MNFASLRIKEPLTVDFNKDSRLLNAGDVGFNRSIENDSKDLKLKSISVVATVGPGFGFSTEVVVDEVMRGVFVVVVAVDNDTVEFVVGGAVVVSAVKTKMDCYYYLVIIETIIRHLLLFSCS